MSDTTDPYNQTAMDYAGYVQYLPMTDQWVFGTDPSLHALDLLSKEGAALGFGSGGPNASDAKTFSGMTTDQIAAKNASMTPEERHAYWNGGSDATTANTGKNVTVVQGKPVVANPQGAFDSFQRPYGVWLPSLLMPNSTAATIQSGVDVMNNPTSVSEQAGNGPGFLGLSATKLIVIVAGLILLAVAAKSIVGKQEE